MKGIIPSFAHLPLAGGNLIEGWLWSEEETASNPGAPRHRATDWLVTTDTEVCAVAKGWAKASYHFRANTPVKGVYGEADGYGLGRFVTIFHPEVSVVTLYAHLDQIDPGIPWIEPVLSEKGYESSLFFQTATELMEGAQLIEQDQAIGVAGHSGLRGSKEHWLDPVPSALPSWDRKHLHLEFYQVLQGGRWLIFDPFGIENTAAHYMKEGRFQLGTQHVWQLDKEGQPISGNNPRPGS